MCMDGLLKRMLLLAGMLLVCCALVVWGLSTLDHDRDWNVPGRTTDAGKSSIK